jgi:uncharacterized membrane protein
LRDHINIHSISEFIKSTNHQIVKQKKYIYIDIDILLTSNRQEHLHKQSILCDEQNNVQLSIEHNQKTEYILHRLHSHIHMFTTTHQHSNKPFKSIREVNHSQKENDKRRMRKEREGESE